MKKNIIAGSFLLIGMFSFGQSSVPQSNGKVVQSEVVSLKPADGKPFVFATREEMEQSIESKSKSYRSQIAQGHSNPEYIKELRENLWRLENAVVKENQTK